MEQGKRFLLENVDNRFRELYVVVTVLNVFEIKKE